MKGVKRYKFPIIRLINSVLVIFSMVTEINNNIYLKVPKEIEILRNLITGEKTVTVTL